MDYQVSPTTPGQNDPRVLNPFQRRQIGPLMMLRDRPVDLQCQGQRGAPIFNGYNRFATGLHRLKKGSQLCLQGFSWLDRWLLNVDPRHRTRAWRNAFSPHQRQRRSLVHADGDYILPRVVDRDVLVWLEEAQFTNALRAYPAGGEVGHATRLELQTNVGNIHTWTEHW